MPALSLKEQIARTDNTFERAGRSWVGKCLICNGRLSFDARGGFGANVEHIVPRTEGGANDLLNLGLTHLHCNAEKGRNWDNRKKRSDAARYEALVGGFLARRKAAGAMRSLRKISRTRGGKAAGRTPRATSTRDAPRQFRSRT